MPLLRVQVSVTRLPTTCRGGWCASRTSAQCLVPWSTPTAAAATPTNNHGDRLMRGSSGFASLLVLLQPAGALLLLDVVLLLDRVTRPRQRLEARARDGLARRLADAVDAVVDAAQR